MLPLARGRPPIGHEPADHLDCNRYLVWDKNLRGFHIAVTRSTRSYRVQWDLPARESLRRRKGRKARGETIVITVGRVGAMSCRDAKREATRLLNLIRNGTDPRRPSDVDGCTLTTAWEAYRQALENKRSSPRTIECYKYSLGLLKSWHDTPLATLASDKGAAEMVREHTRITKTSGPYAANGAMVALRVVYRHARRTNSALPPEPPTRAVTFNRTPPPRTGIGLAALPAWAAQMRERVKRPIRRALHEFTLHTALRRATVIVLRWEDVGEDSILIRKPKRGEERAFRIPMVPAIRRCLERAKKAAGDSPWVFPSNRSKDGHIVEIKEDGLLVGHDLRRTWRTVAAEVGVSRISTKLIMNHRLSRDVTDDYASDAALQDLIRRDLERVTNAIERALGYSPDSVDASTEQLSREERGASQTQHAAC
jgi:integrase